jgi:hypothetical protein
LTHEQGVNAMKSLFVREAALWFLLASLSLERYEMPSSTTERGPA